MKFIAMGRSAKKKVADIWPPFSMCKRRGVGRGGLKE